MASGMTKTTVSGIGVVASIAIVAGTYFFGMSPLNEKANQVEQEKMTAETVNVSKNANLENLRQGAVDIDNAEKEVENFDKIISTSVDIESASRAIAAAETSGINITSFTFGTPEAIAPREEPVATLDQFSAPFDASGSITEDTSENAEGGGGGAQRLPIVIEVTADSQNAFTKYLNALAEQDRLVFVTGVSSNSADTTTATIYAYAYYEER